MQCIIITRDEAEYSSFLEMDIYDGNVYTMEVKMNGSSVRMRRIAITAAACLTLLLMMVLLQGLTNQAYAADESWVSLEVLGEEVSSDPDLPSHLPSGMSYSRETRTLTLNNINVTVPKDTEFIHANIWDYSDESEPLKIKLIGNNTVTCQESDLDQAEKLMYIEKVAFEGSGTLTVKNNPGAFLTCVHGASVSGCTLNIGNPLSSPEYIIDTYNQEGGGLTLSDCTINITYDVADTMEWAEQNYICGGIFDIDSDFIMKNAKLNINTKFTGYKSTYVDGEDYCSCMIDCTGNGEFRNSTVNITGGFFDSLGDYKQLIIDNTTLKGYKRLFAYEKTVFVNKHLYGNQDEPEYLVVYQGTYLPKKTDYGNGVFVSEGLNLFTKDIVPGDKPASPSAPASNTADNKTAVGTTQKAGGNTYKVIKNASGSAAGTIAFTKAKNVSSVTVPTTVKINGKTFKVTQINANAFKGKKIRTVTVSKNVRIIKKNAFKGSRVIKLIVKSKSLTKKSVKGALKGSKVRTIQVKIGKKSVNKKYVKKYKKIFTKKNAGRKVTVK